MPLPSPRSRTFPTRSRRWSVASVAAVSACCLVGALVAPPLAGGTTETGSPQPELSVFSTHYKGSSPTTGGTVLSNGDIAFASSGPSSDEIKVCVVDPGSSTCSSTATITGPSGLSLTGLSLVSVDGSEVTVLTQVQGTYDADIYPIVAYTSNNGGQTFPTDPVIVSDDLYGIDSATVTNGQVVIASSDPHTGLEVEQVDLSGGSPSYALVSSDTSENASITAYGSDGILVGNDDTTNAHVWYSTGNFNTAGDYDEVGAFTNRKMDNLSGDAVLLSTGISTVGRIAFFNGTAFGSASKVPDTLAGDDTSGVLGETGDAAGRSDTGAYHVFFEGRRNSYDLIEETATLSGSTPSWSSQTFYPSAVASFGNVPVLAATGGGLVFETTGQSNVRVQPIYLKISASISLEKTHITSGSSTTLNGSVNIGIQGLGVELQKETNSGAWRDIASSTEVTAGSFSFTVNKAGTYRAVVDDTSFDWMRFGYSNGATLSVKPA